MTASWASMVARVTLNDLPWDLFESCHNQHCPSCSTEPPAVEGGDPVTIEDRFNLRARVAAEPPGRYVGLWQIDTGAPGRAATWEPPTASDSVKIARIRKLVTEWERRSHATTGDPFLGGMATALHEVAVELKSILDDPDPIPVVADQEGP